MMKTTAKIKAYIAGFIDGEGCLHITKVRRGIKTDNYCLTLTINLTCIEPLKLIQRHYGGAIYTRQLEKEGRKNQYIFCLSTQATIRLIKDIKKYFLIKNRQAELAIRFVEIKDKYGKRGVRGEKYFIEMQEVCKREMHRLNARGINQEINSNYETMIQELEDEENRQFQLFYKR